MKTLAPPGTSASGSCQWWEVRALVHPVPHVRSQNGRGVGLEMVGSDLDAGTLRVHRQLQWIREGGGLVVSEPKTRSDGPWTCPRGAVGALRSHRKSQLDEDAEGASACRASTSLTPPPNASGTVRVITPGLTTVFLHHRVTPAGACARRRKRSKLGQRPPSPPRGSARCALGPWR